jgi:hypothetical protein
LSRARWGMLVGGGVAGVLQAMSVMGGRPTTMSVVCLVSIVGVVYRMGGGWFGSRIAPEIT